MKNNRILKLVFICLITAAVLSLAPQGGTRPAAAQIGSCAVMGDPYPGLDCPSWFRTGGCWNCYFSHVTCDEWGNCCCYYTPSINDGRVCPSYCY